MGGLAPYGSEDIDEKHLGPVGLIVVVLVSQQCVLLHLHLLLRYSLVCRATLLLLLPLLPLLSQRGEIAERSKEAVQAR